MLIITKYNKLFNFFKLYSIIFIVETGYFRMNTNKNICIFTIAMLLSLSNSVYSQDLTDENNLSDNFVQNEVFDNNIKANKAALEKAQEAIDQKDFDTAINYMTSYINSKPKKYEGYKLRGDAYYALRRYDLAQSDYQSAVNIKLDDDKLMTNTKYVSAIILGADKTEQLQNTELGNLYARLMYAQKALNNPEYSTSYENAIKYNSHIYLPQPKQSDISQINCPQKYGKELNPQGIDAEIYGAITDIENKKYNDALYKLQKVTSNYPDYYLGHYLYGVSLIGLDSEKEAITSFEKALSLNPYDFESLASLGQIYYSNAETNFSQQDAQKSTDYFQKALKYNPNCNTYYMYIGLNQLIQGNNSHAIAAFDKAINLNANDYNSIYYKSIAQYINGNYNEVINNTTSLLRKHVSNYNSVLYLRALAYYKQNDTEKALADLNEIQNNIEDIYNADLKVVSDKEKALNNYVYYLKAQLQHQQGLGAATDMDKALQNPIIAQLSKAENALKPYEKILNKENFTKDDFDKFESFYKTSLPKLLQSGTVITADDINNQYDFIRTTFSDLGITFLPSGNEYKMTTISEFPYKKYSSKLSQEDRTNISSNMPVQSVSSILPVTKTVTMRESTPQSELLLRGNHGSVAQLLATNALALQSIPKAEPTETKITTTEDIKEPPEIIKPIPQTPASEGIKTNNISSGEPFIFTEKSLLNEENAKNVKEILDVEKTIENNGKTIAEPFKISAKEIKESTTFDITHEKPEAKNATEALNYITNGNKITAKEIKETPDITIKAETPSFIKKAEPIVDNTVKTAENGSMIFKAPEEKQTEDIVIKYGDAASAVAKKVNDTAKEAIKETPELRAEKEIIDNTTKVKETTKPLENEVKIASRTINTKYADVNPADFGVQTKPTPVFTSLDDVIELDKGSLMQDLEGNKNYAKNLEEEINKRLEQQQQNLMKAFSNDMTDAITLPEEETKIVQATDQQATVAVPAVVVPEINTPEKKTDIPEDLKNAENPVVLSQKTLSETLKDSNKITDYTIKYHPVQKEPETTVFTNISKEKTNLTESTKSLAKAQKEEIQRKEEEAKELARLEAQKLKEAEEKERYLAQQKEEQAKALAKAQKEEILRKEEEAKEIARLEAQKLKEAEEKERYLAQQKEEQAKALAKAQEKERRQELYDAKIAAEEERQRLKDEAKYAKEQAKLKATISKAEAKKAAEEEKVNIIAEREKAKAQAKAMKEAKKAEAAEEKARIKAEKEEAKAMAKAQRQTQKAVNKLQKQELAKAKAQAKQEAKELAAEQKVQEKTNAQIKAEILKAERADAIEQAKKEKAETKAIAKAQKLKIKQARDEAKAKAKEQAQLEKEAIKTQKAKEKAKADIEKTAEKEAQKIKKEILKTRKAQMEKQERAVSNTKQKKKFSWKNLFRKNK